MTFYQCSDAGLITGLSFRNLRDQILTEAVANPKFGDKLQQLLIAELEKLPEPQRWFMLMTARRWVTNTRPSSIPDSARDVIEDASPTSRPGVEANNRHQMETTPHFPGSMAPGCRE